MSVIRFPQELNTPACVSPAAYRETYAKHLDHGARELLRWIEGTLSSRKEASPGVSVVLGSGLAGLAGELEILGVLPFEAVGLPCASADGHAGTFTLGVSDGRAILMQSGRLHCYENWHPAIVALPVRMQAVAGIRTFILTHAAGSLDSSVKIGEVVALTGDRGAEGYSPNNGLYDDERFDGPFGRRFFSTSDLYDANLRERFISCARELSYHVHQGVLQFMPGPRFEQANEIAEFVRLRKQAIASGEDLHALITVGMSIAPEAAALCQLRTHPRFADLRTLAISNVTNMAHGINGSLPDSDEVLATGPIGGQKIKNIVKRLCASL